MLADSRSDHGGIPVPGCDRFLRVDGVRTAIHRPAGYHTYHIPCWPITIRSWFWSGIPTMVDSTNVRRSFLLQLLFCSTVTTFILFMFRAYILYFLLLISNSEEGNVL